jgi:hypothetical protein
VIEIGPTSSIALAILGGMLIAFGLIAIWRDRPLPGSFMRAETYRQGVTADSDDADVDIVASAERRADAIEAAPQSRLQDIATSVLRSAQTPVGSFGQAPPALDELRNSIAAIRSETLDDAPEAIRQDWIEHRWAEMQSVIAGAVDTINETTAVVGLSIGSVGESNWSFKNRGFGCYRRILSGQDSVAWLRLELAPEGKMVAKVRAHRDEHAAINCRVETSSATLTEKAATETLARVLKPISEFVAWHPPTLADQTRADQTRADQQSQTASASDAATPPYYASSYTWADIAKVADEALGLSNGALSQAGAKLIVLADPVFDLVADRDRWPLAIDVHGRTVALMHVDRLGDSVEVAVGVADRNRVDLERFRQSAIEGLSARSLAEVMASCAWPSIADAHEAGRKQAAAQ